MAFRKVYRDFPSVMPVRPIDYQTPGEPMVIVQPPVELDVLVEQPTGRVVSSERAIVPPEERIIPAQPSSARVIVTDVLPPGALVSVNDAARLAGIARRTMYYWIARGLVRTSRVASGRLRVEVASLFRPQEPAA